MWAERLLDLSLERLNGCLVGGKTAKAEGKYGDGENDGPA